MTFVLRDVMSVCGLGLATITGCGPQDRSHEFGDASADGSTSTTASAGSSSSGRDERETEPDTGSSSGEPIYDVGPGSSDPACKVVELDGPPPDCRTTVPPDTFDPVLEWSFSTDPETRAHLHSAVIPLVANLTDDDGNGVVDLCDIPDVVLVAGDASGCSIYILDGQTGDLHTAIRDANIDCYATPALADLDGDGVPEIVAAVRVPDESIGYLVAYGPAGTVSWVAEVDHVIPPLGITPTSPVAIHDLDADGSPEILWGNAVYDAAGKLVWQRGESLHAWTPGAFAVDLTGDGRLEIIDGREIVALERIGGTWDRVQGGLDTIAPEPPNPSFALAHVADFLTELPGPEILVVTTDGYLLMTPEGELPWGPDYIVPAGLSCETGSATSWLRPATVHDFDGDGRVDFALSACDQFVLYAATVSGPVPMWSTTVEDQSGMSGSTAFDFLSDGTPEPIYSDEHTAWAWTSDGPGTWTSRLELSRRSLTWIEYPIVVDVDNDGSAEILVVSWDGGAPALQVFGTVNDDWAQARRIWNQHDYFVTNVREDGTIPAHPDAPWLSLNTFRANSPIEDGGVCVPAG